jgi:hypothetical protein
MPQIPWDKILDASGLMGLKSASFAYRESHDGSQVDFFIAAPEPGRQGLFKMIAAAPKDAGAAVVRARRRGEILALARGRPGRLGHAAKNAR